MFLFLKLYLAHLIGDFVLQFEELYRLKVQSRWGHFWHVMVHVAVSLILVIPYWGSPEIWAFIFAIATFHLLQDLFKYSLEPKVRWKFPLFMIDQLCHGLFISLIFFLPISQEIRGFPNFQNLHEVYVNPFWTKLAIIFLITTFAGPYILHAFRRNYMARKSRPDHGITSFEMIHGLFEKGGIMVLCLFYYNSFFFLFALFMLAIPRLLIKRLNNIDDITLNFLYAGILNYCFFRPWLFAY